MGSTAGASSQDHPDQRPAEEGVPNSYSDPESLEIIRQHGEQHRNLGTLAIVAAAQRDGARLNWLSGRDVWATFDDRRVPIAAHCATESTLSTAIVADKTLAKQLMQRGGVRVPSGRLVTSAADTVAAQQELGRPVVVKPRYGLQSRGVTVNVTEPSDLEAAYHRARRQGRDILVEEFIDGLEYRVHANDRECLGVFRRILPNVVGDGASTILELVRAKNEFRKGNPSTTRHPIPTDEVAEGYLRRRGLSWESVVPQGERIIVRDVNGITSGGDSVECFDSASDALKEIAVRAVAAIPGMDWAGADILVEHGSGDPYVMEINTDAAINGSTFPVYGTPRDLGGLAWRQKYANSRPEVRTEPRAVGPVDSPAPMSADVGDLDMLDMFVESLTRRGYEVAEHGGRIMTASKDGSELWFSGCSTGSDLLLSNRHLRRYMQQRQTLRRAGVPRPPARRIREVGQLAEFRAQQDSPVALLKTDGLQAGGTPKVYGVDEALPASLPEGQDSWCAQLRPDGPRVRLVATEEAALVAVASSEDARVIRAEQLDEASQTAVRAVRAVPQLRWAVVDLVLPDDGSERGVDRATVEMMTVRPRFAGTDMVVGGSFEDVFDTIIAGASEWTPTRAPKGSAPAEGADEHDSIDAAPGTMPPTAAPEAVSASGADESDGPVRLWDAEALAELLDGTWTRQPSPQWRPESLFSVRRVLRRGPRLRTGVLSSSNTPARSVRRLRESEVDPEKVALLVPASAELPDSSYRCSGSMMWIALWRRCPQRGVRCSTAQCSP